MKSLFQNNKKNENNVENGFGFIEENEEISSEKSKNN